MFRKECQHTPKVPLKISAFNGTHGGLKDSLSTTNKVKSTRFASTSTKSMYMWNKERYLRENLFDTSEAGIISS